MILNFSYLPVHRRNLMHEYVENLLRRNIDFCSLYLQSNIQKWSTYGAVKHSSEDRKIHLKREKTAKRKIIHRSLQQILIEFTNLVSLCTFIN